MKLYLIRTIDIQDARKLKSKNDNDVWDLIDRLNAFKLFVNGFLNQKGNKR